MTRSTGPEELKRTGADLLTDKQHQRLQKVFTVDEHVEVEATWRIYQKNVAAYRNPSKSQGREQLEAVIESLRQAVPRRLHELISLGRTFHRRAADILAYLDRPGTSNGPTEAINGRLEHLRGTALGFRNLAHYITRSLLDTGGFRPLLHPHLR
ncbi:transposase [Nesterenkonia aurantiaca]|uniref:Transposase n=1 Tax=Nesterenkonia aurantiaca TaxID=1436010 RepID=A0A4R7FUT6_9MICC|nr:transposase [Nesterenkonia aurantiaca]